MEVDDTVPVGLVSLLLELCAAEKDQELANVALAPHLLQALSTANGTAISSLFSPITSQASSLPVLHPNVAAALMLELQSDEASGALIELSTEGLQEHPATARVASLLTRVVLPQLVQAAQGVVKLHGPLGLFCVAPGAGRGLPQELCELRRSYALHYRPKESQAAPADNGRVFRCHVDDCDVTLATCLGCAAEDTPEWTGADLHYVDAEQGGGPQPGTSDLSDPNVVVQQHKHVPGTGVLHGGGAYHYVSPLLEGERATLVVQAMWEDGWEWKKTFLAC